MLHFEEERRLLYVAITRARERAYVTYVRGNLSKDKKQWFELERSFFLSSIVTSMQFTAFPLDEVEEQAQPAFRHWQPNLVEIAELMVG